MEKLIAKIRRRLPETQKLRKSRGVDMIRKNGEYYLLDINTNSVIDTHINLNECFERLESERYYGDSYFKLKKKQKDVENLDESVEKRVALASIKILSDLSITLEKFDKLRVQSELSDDTIKEFEDGVKSFDAFMKNMTSR